MWAKYAERHRSSIFPLSFCISLSLYAETTVLPCGQLAFSLSPSNALVPFCTRRIQIITHLVSTSAQCAARVNIYWNALPQEKHFFLEKEKNKASLWFPQRSARRLFQSLWGLLVDVDAPLNSRKASSSQISSFQSAERDSTPCGARLKLPMRPGSKSQCKYLLLAPCEQT